MSAPGPCCSACLAVCFCLTVLLVSFTAFFFMGGFDPFQPNYTIRSISVKNFNVSSSTTTTTTSEFHVTVRAENPNDKAGILYLPGSSASVFHDYVRVWSGPLPAFLQGAENVTVLTATLKGARVDLTRAGLVPDGRAPVLLRVVMKVKMKWTSWTWRKIEMLVECWLVVDKLFTDAKIGANSKCYYY